MKKCGVIMPISSMASTNEMYTEKHWKKILTLIKTSALKAVFLAELVSTKEETHFIQNTIRENLINNEIVICDISGLNPNVMLELGFRIACNKPVIIIKDNNTHYPFDISPIRFENYNITLSEASNLSEQEAFQNSLTNIIKATYTASSNLWSLSTRCVDSFSNITPLSAVKKWETLDHPYLKKIFNMKITNFLTENVELLIGTYRTTPHSIETFGVEGLLQTKKSLKAVSSITDYWKDPFASSYLNAHKTLLDKGVRIQRIFLIPKGKKEQEYVNLMAHQVKMGIEVFYIYRNDKYITEEERNLDYLIQDDNLIVELFCRTHRYIKDSQKMN